jgi:hypothetical protein
MFVLQTFHVSTRQDPRWLTHDLRILVSANDDDSVVVRRRAVDARNLDPTLRTILPPRVKHETHHRVLACRAASVSAEVGPGANLPHGCGNSVTVIRLRSDGEAKSEAICTGVNHPKVRQVETKAPRRP